MGAAVFIINSCCASSSANGEMMPMPSTKPSSSTYIMMAKPMRKNHATGRVVERSMSAHLVLVDRRPWPRRRFAEVDADPRRRRARALAQHLEQIPAAEAEQDH